MATQANIPLTAYTGPVLGANWWRRYLTSNRSWYLAAATLILGYLFLFLLGALANVGGFRGINWFLGFTVQLVALVVVASWLHFVPVAGLGFIAGQDGGTPGPSTSDGLDKAEKWLSKLGRFVLHVGLNAPVAFYALAIWPIQDYPYLAFIVLAAGVSITLAATLIWPDSKTMFWTKLLWVVHLLIVLGAVAFFSAKALAPEQSRRLTSWVETRLSVNDADRAKDKAEEETRQAALKAADACYKSLSANPTAEALDRCEALRKTAGQFLYRNEAEQARIEANNQLRQTRIRAATECYKKLGVKATMQEKEACDALYRDIDQTMPTAPEVVEAPAPVIAAMPAPTPVETAWRCDTIVKEVEYSPGHQYGPVAIDTFPAGKYEVSVAGKRQQPFYTGIPAVLDKLCEMDADGNMGVCRNAVGKPVSDLGGRNWPAPAQALVPSNQYMNFPYGMFVIRAMGKVLPIGSEGRIESSRPVHIEFDVNNFQSPLNYGGQGNLRVQIRQCV